MSDFDKAFDRTIRPTHEGGFSDDPDDNGNWTGGRKGAGQLNGTKYGISAATYPDLDIKNLTPEQVKEIYRTDWWEPLADFGLPGDLVSMLFDMAINTGKGPAIRCLQRAVKVQADGILGPVTRAAVMAEYGPDLMQEVTVRRIMYYTECETWSRHGLGWVRRSIKTLMEVV